jgi:hypothetical protein
MIGSSGILEGTLNLEQGSASATEAAIGIEIDVRPPPMPASTSPIGPSLHQGQYRVLAFEAISTGTQLLQLTGLVVDQPNRLSVQVDEHLHVAPPPTMPPNEDPERYLWRFLNHSCEPNAYWTKRTLIALRDIAAWEEITFDYNCTELEIAEPFKYGCGACEGNLIRGFLHLDTREQGRRESHLRTYLKLRLNRTPSA